nr:hypothetical protein GCM10017611_65980 [Rhodococcus wratislaviensis]
MYRDWRPTSTSLLALHWNHCQGCPPQGCSLSAELLFQVLTEREEKNSVGIASNQSFSGWTRTFTDPRLCAAIVDRLTFGGAIIETGTDSYRLAQTRAAAQAAS